MSSEGSPDHAPHNEAVVDESAGWAGPADSTPDDLRAQEHDADDTSAEVEQAEVGADPVAAVARERDEYLDALRRLQAEFENYKKRMMRQQTEHLDRAAETLVVKLLPALDTIELALSHVDPDGDAGKAITQVSSALYDVLGKEGLEKLDPLGQEFDPNEAEAVMHEPAEEGQTGHAVSEVLRPGFKWKGRVVRPAMVKVKG